MENRLKLRISRLFHASLNSCATGNPEEIAQEPVFIGNQDFRQPSCSKPRGFSTKKEIAAVVSAGCACKPKKPWEKAVGIPGKNCGDAQWRSLEENRQVLEQVPGMKLTRRRFGGAEGRICPPVSPASPANMCFKLQDISNKKKKRTKKKELQRKGFEEPLSNNNRLSFSSAETGWFSSEAEREKETAALFSSKSLSSDSSEFYPIKRTERRKSRRRTRCRGINSGGGEGFLSGGGFRPEIPSAATGKFRESVVVVKRSRDPHKDFKSSMVEMIIEKQIFEAEDLEELLQCFLSLNASYHHRVIVEVFTEIWECLFSNLS